MTHFLDLLETPEVLKFLKKLNLNLRANLIPCRLLLRKRLVLKETGRFNPSKLRAVLFTLHSAVAHLEGYLKLSLYM